jgi:hypothetical protein
MRSGIWMCCLGIGLLHMMGCAADVGPEDTSTEGALEMTPGLEPAATGYCGTWVRNVSCKKVGSGPYSGVCGSKTWKYWACTRHEFTAGRYVDSCDGGHEVCSEPNDNCGGSTCSWGN